MGRPKKDAKYLNVYIRRDIYDEFDELCRRLGQSKTVAAERALMKYMQDSDDHEFDTNKMRKRMMAHE